MPTNPPYNTPGSDPLNPGFSENPRNQAPRPKRASKKRWVFIGIFLLVLIILFVVNHAKPGSDDSKKVEKPGTSKHPVLVTIAQSYQSDVPIKLQIIGNVLSISSVTLKPQVDGPVQSLTFKEGDFVKSGQLLFVIDPSPYQAALAQAQATVSKDIALIRQAQDTLSKDTTVVTQARANMRRDQASLVYAQAEEKRYKGLLQQGFVSVEQYEQMRATSQADVGTVEADRAAISTAQATLPTDISAIRSAQETLKGDQAAVRTNQIKLNFCYIHAPFTGRTGSFLVHTGDAVQTGVTNLVSLSKINPTFVQFAVPENELPAIKKQQDIGELGVTAVLDDPQHTHVSGRITFSDNTVDTTTGTINLRGVFDNPTNRLWPGQFVTVVLSMGKITNAVVVPPEAVQTGQKGDYVFVVNNGIAELRLVKVARTTNRLAAITSGLNSGEEVVTDGQLQLEQGSHVRIKRNVGGHGAEGGASNSPDSASPNAEGQNNPAGSNRADNTQGNQAAPDGHPLAKENGDEPAGNWHHHHPAGSDNESAKSQDNSNQNNSGTDGQPHHHHHHHNPDENSDTP